MLRWDAASTVEREQMQADVFKVLEDVGTTAGKIMVQGNIATNRYDLWPIGGEIGQANLRNGLGAAMDLGDKLELTAQGVTLIFHRETPAEVAQDFEYILG